MSKMSSQEKLTFLGGKPIRQKPWPEWPRADNNTERLLLEVLHSGRWAISGTYTGVKPYERQFAEAYATFHDVPYCVPTANGSSALTIAMEALNVHFGTEVLVPGLTWVACASSVAGIGAVPILIDVEPDTLCMNVELAKKAITENTSAIMLVHLFCAVADIDAFVALSKETGIPIIEDCSQAHGAMWRGQRVGTFGKIGVFSMQQTKVLTSGEGGAAITRDPDLYDRMQQLRADGRRYDDSALGSGDMELKEIGLVQGRNYCMSEFHAAILLDRLNHLEAENRLREQNADYLHSLLREVGGIIPLHRNSKVDRLTYYHFCVRINLEEFGHNSIDSICKALTAELNILIEPVDAPLNRNILYNPLLSPRTPVSEDIRKRFDPKRFSLPIALKARQECLTIPHRVLLGDKTDMENIAEAFAKVKNNHEALSQLSLNG